jgi:hypothetical protein
MRLMSAWRTPDRSESSRCDRPRATRAVLVGVLAEFIAENASYVVVFGSSYGARLTALAIAAADYRISSLSITEIPQGVSGAEGLG